MATAVTFLLKTGQNQFSPYKKHPAFCRYYFLKDSFRKELPAFPALWFYAPEDHRRRGQWLTAWTMGWSLSSTTFSLSDEEKESQTLYLFPQLKEGLLSVLSQRAVARAESGNTSASTPSDPQEVLSERWLSQLTQAPRVYFPFIPRTLRSLAF